MATNMTSAGVDMNVFDQDLNFDESLLYVWSSSWPFPRVSAFLSSFPVPPPGDIGLSPFHIARSTCQAHGEACHVMACRANAPSPGHASYVEYLGKGLYG